jgi:PIN domain nuclease of toxin-antitoxin system
VFLIDSHVIVWLLTERHRIRKTAFDLLSDQGAGLTVSLATVWEIELKRGLGKLNLGEFRWSEPQVVSSFSVLPITLQDIERAAYLPLFHRDPFDRMLVAQAMNRGLAIMTSDPFLPLYGVPVIQA